MRFGGLEVLFVFAIVLLFFGPKQIPKLTGVLKDSIKEFKTGEADDSEEETENKDDAEAISQTAK